MARCESNYWRLLQVFPAMSKEESRHVGLAGRADRNIVLSVKERTPFTTLLVIEEQGGPETSDAGEHLWCRSPTLQVRMYHDALLAEVVNYDRMRTIKPKNPYPNKNMLQRDEKAQWNRFLEEWLTVCIEHGYVAELAPVL